MGLVLHPIVSDRISGDFADAGGPGRPRPLEGPSEGPGQARATSGAEAEAQARATSGAEAEAQARAHQAPATR
jgi:hypothetical protein